MNPGSAWQREMPCRTDSQDEILATASGSHYAGDSVRLGLRTPQIHLHTAYMFWVFSCLSHEAFRSAEILILRNRLTLSARILCRREREREAETGNSKGQEQRNSALVSYFEMIAPSDSGVFSDEIGFSGLEGLRFPG